MRVLFVSSFAPLVSDLDASKRFYIDDLGLPLEGDYPMSDEIEGVKHFGLWSLAEAAKSCFGSDQWPDDVPVPSASIEFDVDDVAAAAEEMQQKGHRLLHEAKTEPWGQTIARVLSPEGLIVGLSNTPWMRSDKPS